MLISPAVSFSPNDVVGFKLITGEEIVTKIVESNDNSYVISKPLTLMPSQQGMAMVQTLIGANTDKPIVLNKRNIMFEFPVIAQLEKHYTETTSGISLA